MRPLVPHPSQAASPYRLTATAERSSNHQLRLHYRLDGDLTDIRLPPPAPIQRGTLLWQHTCFEAFVGRVGESPYQELNFSPSGAWDAHAFTGYRHGGPMALDTTAPTMTIRRSPHAVEIAAAVVVELPGAVWRIALSAVIEHRDGHLSYWALHHPPGQPDFHHPSAFLLQLDPSA